MHDNHDMTWCSSTSSLRAHARPATAWCEAARTTKSLGQPTRRNRERPSSLQASMRKETRLER